MSQDLANQSNQQSNQRKKYIEIVGFDYYEEPIDFPTLWIDPTDLETIRQFERFWNVRFYNMQVEFLKQDKDKRQDYLKLLLKCAQTLSQHGYKAQKSSIMFAFRLLKQCFEKNAPITRQTRDQQFNGQKIKKPSGEKLSHDSKGKKKSISEQYKQPSPSQPQTKLSLSSIKKKISGFFTSFFKSQDHDLNAKLLTKEVKEFQND